MAVAVVLGNPLRQLVAVAVVNYLVVILVVLPAVHKAAISKALME